MIFYFLAALRIRFTVCFGRCRNLEKAIMIVKAEEEGIGELKNLSAHFNIMADKLQKQMEEIREERTRAVSRWRRSLLQSQINPHFLI